MRRTIIFIWIIILLFGLAFQPAFGQTKEQEQRQALEQLGIYPYPSEDEVKDSVLSPEGFVVEPLSTDDINEDFSNIEDLAWLEQIAKDHRVILVGESHYYQYIHHLRNRILFTLNTFDMYPTLMLEQQYSKTPFLNHYLSLTNEVEAKQFEQEILDFFINASEYRLLNHLRRWNVAHPEKHIQVGCYDIEHDYALTFRHILLPYFSGLKQAFATDGHPSQEDVFEPLEDLDRLFWIHSLEKLDTAFSQVEQYLTLAKEQQFVGKYSFLTPEYIEGVIENLKSTYNAYTQDFFSYRQQAMIRNLTDVRFLGDYFTTGKVVLHAGGYHTATHTPPPTGQHFFREGAYLTYKFELTKGRTYSIKMWGLAFSSVLDMTDGDMLMSGYPSRTDYGCLVRKIQLAAAQGLLSPDAAYSFLLDEPLTTDASQPHQSPGMEAFMKLIVHIAYQHQNQPLLVRQFPWKSLFHQAKQLSPDDYKTLLAIQEALQQHDLNIWIPNSPMVKPKKRVK